MSSRWGPIAAAVGGALALVVACAEPNLTEEEKAKEAERQAKEMEQADSSMAPPPPQEDSSTPPPPGPQCDSSNCPTGCCINAVCFTDHTPEHCATSGVGCPAKCPSNSCVAQAKTFVCAAPLAANYGVTLVGASVLNGADGAGDLPDVYVNTGAFGKLVIPRTATKDNTLSPVWNVALGTLANADIVGASITAEVKDDDSFGSDTAMGTCTHAITLAEVQAGKIVIPTSHCTLDIVSMEFTLQAK